MEILVRQLLPIVVLATIPLAAQPRELHPLDLDIAGPDGGFHLTGTLCGAYSEVRKKREPQLSGAIVGKETSWTEVRFRITLRAGAVEKGVIWNVPNIPSDKPRTFVLEMYQHWNDFPDCKIDDVKFEFMKGSSEAEQQREDAAARAEEIARKKRVSQAAATRAAEENAARKRRAEAAAARAAYLAKLPLINSGSAALFLASDRKCAVQFQ